jgi:hypothetical protein
VVPDYIAPFAFTAKLNKVTIDLSGELIQSSEAAMRMVTVGPSHACDANLPTRCLAGSGEGPTHLVLGI